MMFSKITILVVLFLSMASCGGKMKLDANIGAKVEVKKEVEVESQKEAPPPPPKEPTTEELLVAAVDSENRPVEEKARDQYRHPIETLRFFGLSNEMTVLEVEPGQGWYTRILAPTLKDKGQLIVTSVDTNANPESADSQAAAAYAAMLAENKATLGDVKIQVVGEDSVFGESASVDMVVSFRNNHFWAKNRKQEAKIYKGLFDVLKPGGHLGMVMHRGAPDMKVRKALRKGYLPEKYVIAKAEAAGFELVESAEINANPKDTKDYGRGVWSLPPVLAFGEMDREKYLAIGESDRMTLLFKKPGGAEEAAEKTATVEETADDSAEEKVEEKAEEKAEVKPEGGAEVEAGKNEASTVEKVKKKVEKAAAKAEKDIETSNAKKKIEAAADKVDKKIQKATKKQTKDKKVEPKDKTKAEPTAEKKAEKK